MSRTALRSYGTQQVMTSSPVKLIALLYDKAIVSLKEAIQAIEEGQIERRWQSNARAVEIITHLSNTLDREAGADIAAKLDQLYEFMLARLLNVDLRNDPRPAEEVIRLLKPLRDSWHQLAESAPPGSQGVGPAAEAEASAAASTGRRPLPNTMPTEGKAERAARATRPVNVSA